MKELIDELTNVYGLREATVSLIRHGGDGNQTYRVEVEGRPYIARIYGAQGREYPEWVRYEVELLRHLAGCGLSVSTPLDRADREPFGWVDGGPCVIFTFADGGVEWPTRPENAHRLGSSLAQLHVAADSFVSTAMPRAFDRERLLGKPLERMLSFLKDDAETARVLCETARRADTLMAAIPPTGGSIGSIHGDIHQGNCHFTDEGRLTFFDFSNAGVGWRAYDLTGFLWPMRDDTISQPEIRAACDGFLDGYRSVRPLLPEEERALPAFIKARDYWETGNWLEHDTSVDPAVVRGGLKNLAGQFQRFPLE